MTSITEFWKQSSCFSSSSEKWPIQLGEGGGTTWKAKGKLAARNLGHLTDPPPLPLLLQLHFSCHHLCTMCAMRYELVECNQFQANTFFYFNLGCEIKNGTQLCSKIDQNMFNAYSIIQPNIYSQI